jgi:hypothetical protein
MISPYPRSSLILIGQCLIEIGGDIIGVLDSNTEPDHFRGDARLALVVEQGRSVLSAVEGVGNGGG